MLDKVLVFPFTLFVIFLFAFFAVIGVVMFGQWTQVQNEAQMVAVSMGKWGGYTDEAEKAVQDFCSKLNVSRSQVRVQVSSPGPVSWGKTVWARVSVPFQFKLGSYSVGTYTLTGKGYSVSTYLLGAY
ncbi:MAG: hypothetical protein ACPLQP_08705, partial [Moorellaceae bacterium]